MCHPRDHRSEEYESTSETERDPIPDWKRERFPDDDRREDEEWERRKRRKRDGLIARVTTRVASLF